MFIPGSVSHRLYPAGYPGALTPDAVFFDGSAGYMLDSSLSFADSSQGTFSCWVYPTFYDNSPTYHHLMDASTSSGWRNVLWYVDANNAKPSWSLWNSSGTTLVQMNWDHNVPKDQWSHLLYSYDLSGSPATVQCWIDDTEVSPLTTTTLTTGTVGWNGDNFYVGRQSDASRDYYGDMAEFWFDTTYIDISVEANRRKFITSGLKPADMNSNGSGPTGSQPKMYFSGDATTFGTNKGSESGNTANSLTNSTHEPVQL